MSISKPLYIKVNDEDNVAIIVNAGGLPAGTIFDEELILLEAVPEGHKVALTDILVNGKIIRYGKIIGYANTLIKRGSWVEESLVTLPEATPLDQLTHVPELIKSEDPIGDYTFEGYRNPDGTAGTKNLLGISTSVQCVAGVLDIAVQQIKDEVLPKYPNVDGVVALKHNYGCGVAINAPQAIIPIRTIKNLAHHPNFGGELMVVSLGCEKLRPEVVTNGDEKATIVCLQESYGFKDSVQTIVAEAEMILKRLNNRHREICPVSDLVVGLQCGGSDSFSGVTSNPAIGYAADLLVRAGATVLFSEVTEVRDGIEQLFLRAANQKIGEDLLREMKWYDDYLSLGDVDRSANPAPGNKKGGLANIVEKALGSIAKSGTTPINEVLSPGNKPLKKGLIYAATPASDFVCGTMQLASGVHLQVFTTGRGTPYGLAMIPVIKVSSRTTLAERWPDLIDVDAGRIATGNKTIPEVGQEVFQLILDIASGKKESWAEHWKIYNDLCLFNPAPVT